MFRNRLLIFILGLILGYIAGYLTVRNTKIPTTNIKITNQSSIPLKTESHFSSPLSLNNNMEAKRSIIPTPSHSLNVNHSTTTDQEAPQELASLLHRPLTKNEEEITQKIQKISEQITTPKTSALQEKIETEKTAITNPFATLLLRPNYIMPFYYTVDPDKAIYKGQTPEHQPIQKQEFKAQISFQFPLLRHLLGYNVDLMAAYTQLFYWQFYAKSQFFRETNYEPEVFLRHNFLKNWVLNTGIAHESNGRGGALERSWNRVYVNLEFSGVHWYVGIKPWILIFKKESSDLHNEDIRRYLGNGQLLFAYKQHQAVISLLLRNLLESRFKRKTEILTFSYPIKDRLRFFVQLFNGYGQSLIEYNHKTTAAGVGITLNDWI